MINLNNVVGLKCEKIIAIQVDKSHANLREANKSDDMLGSRAWHNSKPFGLADLAASSALKRNRNILLWLHALRLESTATSTIVSFRLIRRIEND